MSAPTSEKLARNLRRLRELRGVSQQRLAELAGVPRPTLANLESGDANPTLSVMVRVAQALGASLEDLVSEPTSSVLERRQAEALVKRRRGRASFQALAEDRALGFCLERIELSPNAKLNQPEGDAARRYLCCEAGELVVSSGRESAELHSGDVVLVRGAGFACQNRGRNIAVLYSLQQRV